MNKTMMEAVMEGQFWGGHWFDPTCPTTYPQTLINAIAKERRVRTVFEIMQNILPAGWKIKFVKKCRFGYDVNPVRKIIRVPQARSYRSVIFIARAAILARYVDSVFLDKSGQKRIVDLAKSSIIRASKLHNVLSGDYFANRPLVQPDRASRINPLYFMVNGKYGDLVSCGFKQIKIILDSGIRARFTPTISYEYPYGSDVVIDYNRASVFDASRCNPRPKFLCWIRNSWAYVNAYGGPSRPFPRSLRHSNFSRLASSPTQHEAVTLACIVSDLNLMSRLLLQPGLLRKTKVFRHDFELSAPAIVLAWLRFYTFIDVYECYHPVVRKFAAINLHDITGVLDVYVSRIVAARVEEDKARASILKDYEKHLDELKNPPDPEIRANLISHKGKEVRPPLSIVRTAFTPRIKLVV